MGMQFSQINKYKIPETPYPESQEQAMDANTTSIFAKYFNEYKKRIKFHCFPKADLQSLL